MDETIVAIATPAGTGGLAVLRLAGAHAIAVADAVFRATAGAVASFATHSVHYGRIVDGPELIDDVLLTLLRAPRSYTGEDTVEVTCHGGRQTAARVLALCLRHGARLAEPGEFTKRAFLNGRIDLAQAEAVLDVIQSRTERARQAAAHMLQGHLSVRIAALRERLLDDLALVEAHIDFPEEDLPALARAKLEADVAAAQAEVARLLATADEGRILRDGVTIAIVGRPNVGKSSLMNALLGQERSIVTPVPGTTRDIVEESANIRGYPVRLIDTAGLRRARGTVERLGVRRTEDALASTQVVLLVVDGSKRIGPADSQLLGRVSSKQVIVAINKCDLKRQVTLPVEFTSSACLQVSARTGEGLEELRNAIAARCQGPATGGSDVDFSVNERQTNCLVLAQNTLTITATSIHSGDDFAVLAQALRSTLDSLGMIVGKTTSDDVLERIFDSFCIGK